MAIGNDNAQRQPARQPGLDSRLFPAFLAVGFTLFLVGSALFIYQQSRTMGLPALSQLAPLPPTPAPGARPPAALARGAVAGFAHQIGPCTSCHGSVSQQARLYLAIDGRDVSDSPAITLRAGEAFELAFHFEGLLGDPTRHAGVGVEIVLPESGSWSLGPGSGKPVEGWSPAGSGRTFWSPAWQRAGAGDGGQGGRWRAIPAQPGAFYMDYSASSWAVAGNAAAAANRGAEGDGDGRANAMGGDALISVPLNAQPGKYQVLVAAIGHDGRGSPAQFSRRVPVQVEPPPVRPAPSAFATPLPFRRFHDYNGRCGGCHQASRKVPASHVGRTNDMCTNCHTMTIAAPPSRAIPRLPHATDGRDECLACHGPAGLRPAPADHAGRPVTLCRLCHQPATDRGGGIPNIPHATEGRANCLLCHSGYFVPRRPPDHEGRTNDMCALCHQKGAAAPTRGAPLVPHGTTGRTECLACHGRGFFRPIPASHDGRNELSCRGCHQPRPDADEIGGRPKIPHDTAGRSDCVVCHGPAGMRPLPASHKGRASATCTGCHEPGTDRSGLVPKIPHVVAGREACLTCHAGYFVPPVPARHEGRTNDICLSCHGVAGATPVGPSAAPVAVGGSQ